MVQNTFSPFSWIFNTGSQIGQKLCPVKLRSLIFFIGFITIIKIIILFNYAVNLAILYSFLDKTYTRIRNSVVYTNTLNLQNHLNSFKTCMKNVLVMLRVFVYEKEETCPWWSINFMIDESEFRSTRRRTLLTSYNTEKLVWGRLICLVCDTPIIFLYEKLVCQILPCSYFGARIRRRKFLNYVMSR